MISHIFREGNDVADAMAIEGLTWITSHGGIVSQIEQEVLI